MKREEILHLLETKILPLVQKPGRYIGGEVNMAVKDPEQVRVRLALIFPEVYELGMSNLGLKILYELVNSRPHFYAERAYSPWPDLEKYLRRHKLPLFSLETHSALTEFDVIGFTLQYELGYTNLLNILDLARLPLLSKDRQNGSWPLVIAGGPLAVTPEPVAQFIDAFVIGDGEEVIIDFLEFYQENRGEEKTVMLAKLAETIPGIYVPSSYQTKGSLKVQPKTDSVPYPIKKRIVKDLNQVPIPVKQIVPLIDIVHDRFSLEIMRGCPRKCRFCQARVIYQPVRRQQPERLLAAAREAVANTGYKELSLSSLSATDYREIDRLARELINEWPEGGLCLSLPSMRIDSFSLSLVDSISRVKKTGITLAPEAATDRLLEVIGKDVKVADLMAVAAQAYKLGYNLLKLYFMIGLPGEELADLDKLVDLLRQLSRLGKELRGRPVQLNVSIATMIPKPHTFFQRLPMLSAEQIKEKQAYLRERIKLRNVKLSFHPAEQTLLEAVFCRGDRRLGQVLLRAWQLGTKFDQWREHFRYDLWLQAFKDCGIDMNEYLCGWDDSAPLPWDHIDLNPN